MALVIPLVLLTAMVSSTAEEETKNVDVTTAPRSFAIENGLPAWYAREYGNWDVAEMTAVTRSFAIDSGLPAWYAREYGN